MITDHSVFQFRRSYFPGIRIGLETMQNFMEELENPHLQYPRVLVAGTNGKGSTANFLSSLVNFCGKKTGLYTSPHLMGLNERFKINGSSISDQDLLDYLKVLENLSKKKNLKLTFFEMTTALSQKYFKDQNVDLAILEVGMGGRWDATHLGPFVCNILTMISMDHMDYLGHSLVEIASEKAATISPGGTVISDRQAKDSLEVIQKEVKRKGATLFLNGRDFNLTRKGDYFEFHFLSKALFRFPLLDLPSYQENNLSLALASFSFLMAMDQHMSNPFELDFISKAIQKTSLLGRFQFLENPEYLKAKVLLDGAHNPSGMKALVNSLKQRGIAANKLHFILGVKSDKDWRALLKEIPKGLASISLIEGKAAGDQGAIQFISSNDLRKEVLRLGISSKENIRTFHSIIEAYRSVINKLGDQHWLVLTGSLYLLGEFLCHYKNNWRT